MAGSLNKVTLIGRVGKDPEIRYSKSGAKFANFVLATSEQWKDSNGQKVERTEWHRISVWSEPLSEIIEQYVKKGSMLYVEGAIQTRKYQDRDGKDVYAKDIVVPKMRGVVTLLDSRGQSQGGEYKDESSSGESQGGRDMDHDHTHDNEMDDIPF